MKNKEPKIKIELTKDSHKVEVSGRGSELMAVLCSAFMNNEQFFELIKHSVTMFKETKDDVQRIVDGGELNMEEIRRILKDR